MQFEGIVIRRTSYKEGAAMITVLTKERLRSFLAKGVLKITSKNAPSVNLFTKSLFQTFKGSEGEWLRLGEVISSYPNISNDFEKLAVLDFISEITNMLVDTEDCKDIYNFLDKTLSSLNNGFSPLTCALIYFAKVLKATGYGIDLSHCAICGSKEDINHLSLKDGGVICSNCCNNREVSEIEEKKLKILKYIFSVNLDNFEKIALSNNECKNAIFGLAEFIDFTSQIEIKSLTLLREI